MRSLLIIIILAGSLIRANSQEGTSVRISELVAIREKSDFKAFVGLVHRLSYAVLDSSITGDGTLIYITRENKIGGNVLACNVLANKTMDFMAFYTYDSVLSNELKKQVLASDFKTNGKNKFAVQGYVETQEFNKDKKIISLGIKKTENGRFEYEFQFFQF